MTTKKRNPQDSTRRNVQAGAKRDEALARRVTELEAHFDAWIEALPKLLIRVGELERANQSFAANQRSMGYKHSTSAPHQIRVK